MQLFNVLVFGSWLLTRVALCAPSGPSASVARLSRRQSRLNKAPTVSDSGYSPNWAGAVWDQDVNTFTSVTGTFTVPDLSGAADGAAASAWVGIDGDTCQNAIIQTGVSFTRNGGQSIYNAWYEWYPDPSVDLSGITVSAGDILKLTVTVSSSTSGTVTIENQTNRQTVSQDLSSDTSLCGQNAEWIVEDFIRDGAQVPFADFGTIQFTNAVATGAGGSYTPSGANILNLEQNNEVLTSVLTEGSSVTIHYE